MVIAAETESSWSAAQSLLAFFFQRLQVVKPEKATVVFTGHFKAEKATVVFTGHFFPEIAGSKA